MNIPQDAIEAVKQRWTWKSMHWPDLATEQITAILTAALPAIEQQIREYIAREIEAKAPLVYYPHESGYEKYQGMKYAAQVARGEDQP